MPTLLQIALLLISAGLFAACAAAALLKDRGHSTNMVARGVWMCRGVAIALAIVSLILHSADRGSFWPLEDNFDALVWLAVMLGIVVAYIQLRHPIGGLDLFAAPIVVLMLLSAAFFGSNLPRDYHLYSAWLTVHRVCSFGGVVMFAVAAATSTAWLISNDRLRRKQLAAARRVGSLEQLERVNYLMVTLGFAMLSVGLITGFGRLTIVPADERIQWLASPKITLAAVAWLVYALVLHAPINPVFRGKRVAQLSIGGFLLITGVVVAVQFNV